MFDRGGRCYDGRVATVEQPTLVTLTDSAAAKIRDLMAEEPAGEAAVLRIAVQGGGCSGFQYALGFDRGAQEGDNELHVAGVDVVVDPFSAPYLAGTEIDWVEGLQAGFAINNPNVSASCGCEYERWLPLSAWLASRSGVRLLAWVWIRRLLDDWPKIGDLFEDDPDAQRQIAWHQEYLAAFPSRGSSANNHVIAEAAGLLAAASAFPWYAASPRWTACAQSRL